MIDSKQLRIGNLVMYSSIIEVNEHKIRESVEYPYRFAPLRITEKWLLDFGFEKKYDYYWINNKYFGGYAFDLKNLCLVKECPAYGNEFHTTDIIYVHQLQNLFYWLTGEELQVSQNTKS